MILLDKETPKLNELEQELIPPGAFPFEPNEKTIDPNNIEEQELLDLISKYLKMEGYSDALKMFEDETKSHTMSK